MNSFPTSEDRQKWVFKMPNEWLMLNPFHDDRVAYEIAFNECNRQARIAVFGAIRRAAKVARGVDCPCGCHGDLDAKAMRTAIRAAIGSPKA